MSTQLVKNGSHRNTQRYLCKQCGYQFTRKETNIRSHNDRLLAALLYANGMSKNAIAKLMGTSPPTVARWITVIGAKSYGEGGHEKPAVTGVDDVVRYLHSPEAHEKPGKLVIVLQLDSLAEDTGVVFATSPKSLKKPS
ncbi:helix-turn-helix domain-containing protein [Desulfovibrio sp. OttesenSCG-928-G15]|nr:helix-turn-helix domain-containing protein [Desulfovibrio sp. OttesenSCG-928-G15]